MPLLKRMWQRTVQHKIDGQAKVLQKYCNNDYSLNSLSAKVKSGDSENLEGRAARIYWGQMFSGSFIRDRNLADNNMLLNYGYTVLRAMVARAICGAGLHPTLGIQHHNRYNAFCLADDLMEPYRIFVDQAVLQLNPYNNTDIELNRITRRQLLEALQTPVKTASGLWGLSDIIQRMANSAARAFTEKENLLDFYL